MRLLALLVMQIIVFEGYCQRDRGQFWASNFQLKDGNPSIEGVEIKKIEEEKAVVSIYSPSKVVSCRGSKKGKTNNSSGYNNSVPLTSYIEKLTYDIRWQYKIESEEWKDLKRLGEDVWSNNKSNNDLKTPEGWNGTLSYTNEEVNLTIKGVNSDFDIPFESQYAEKPVLKVKLRISWNLKLDLYVTEGVNQGNYESKNLKGESAEKEIVIYQCKGGNFDLAEGLSIPQKNDHYIIYDDDDYKANHKIQFYNTTTFVGYNPQIYYTDGDKFMWGNIKELETNPITTNIQTLEEFEQGCENSTTVGGDSWTIKKRYVISSSSNNECYSNILTFDKFKKVKLEGYPVHYDQDKIQYVCMDKEDSKVTLYGIPATLENSFKEKDYELQYQWEYSLSGQTWRDVVPNNNATYNGTDLIISGEFLSQNNAKSSIYFRPKAYLKLFDIDVRPEQNVIYEVIPYTAPTSKNMKLAVLNEKNATIEKVCEGKEFDGYITLSQRYSTDVFNPTLKCSITPSATEIISDSLGKGIVAKWKIENALSENTTYTVKVENDECKTDDVEYQTTIKVENVVSEPEKELTIEGCSYEYREDGTLYIKAKKNTNITFRCNSANYKYVLNDEGVQRNITSSLTVAPYHYVGKKNISLQKFNLGISQGCGGSLIPVIVEEVDNISGNTIYLQNQTSNTYYVCKGDKNPIINGTEKIDGGYGDKTIKWRRRAVGSQDKGSQIIGSESESNSLPAKIFDITEDCEVVREVTMGNGDFVSISNPIIFKVYKTPDFSITKYDSVMTADDVCFGENPIFNIVNSSAEPNIKNRLGKTSYRIQTYEDGSRVDTTIIGASVYKDWNFKYDATISATQEFCGASVEAVNSMKLKVKEDLTFTDKDFSYDCPMFGKELDITPVIDDTSKYTYKIGSIVYANKKGTSKVKLPSVGGSDFVEATVTRSLNGCDETKAIKISNVLTPLEDRKLYLKGSLDGKNLVCLSKDYEISDNFDNDEANVRYAWKSKTDGATIQNATSSKVSVSLLNGNDFIRTRTLGNNCEVKRDTISIAVLEKSTSTPAINVSEDELCYGEEVKVSVDPIEGYKITSFKKNEIESALLSNNTLTELVKTSGTVTYSVEMTSEKCDNYILNGKTSINVAKNLNEVKKITVSPTDLNKSLFNEKTKTYPVKLTDKNDLGQDIVAFSFNNSDFVPTHISDGVWSTSFNIVESDLDGGQLEGKVYRTLSLTKTKTCVSDTFPFYVSPNVGFDEISINTAGNYLKAGDVFYFCGEGKLQLQNKEIIFNLEVVDDYKLQWYKKTSGGNWFSLKETENEIEITTTDLENSSEYYKLEVSLTKDGKVYKQSSNVIEVRNVAKPNLNIRLTEGEMDFCYAGNVDFELQTTTWSSPTGVTDAKNTYVWQKSYDTKTWNDIEAGVTDDETIAITANNDVSTLAYSESAMIKGTYFRAVMKDVCGKTATSNILLTKTYKGMDLTANDVKVMSNKLVQSKDNFEVKFFVNYSDDKTYSYVYYNEDGEPIESEGTALQVFKYDSNNGESHPNFDYSFGKHKVYVEKVMKETGCKSERVEVEYELIAPIVIKVELGLENGCPNSNEQSGHLHLDYKEGGLPKNGMKATWFYRYDDEDSYQKIDSSIVGFKYALKPNYDEDIKDGLIYNINGLDRTCWIYAEVTNEGYPIKSLKTEEKKLVIYPNFKIARATSDKSLYCYGDDVRLNAGEVLSAYGDVTYKWIDVNDEKKIYSSTETLELDEITKETTFRRIATDECGVNDTYEIDLAVRDKLEMDAEEYMHAEFAEKGKVPYVAVKSMQHVESYVLSHIDQEGMSDVTEVKNEDDLLLNFGTMPVVRYETERFEIYKVDHAGCRSVADTFFVTGIDKITAGTIVFEKYGDQKSIDICHGEKIGRIIDEKVASGGSDITYKWFYIEKGESFAVNDDKGYQITSPVFDLDSIKFGNNVASNGKENGNGIKTYALYREASVNVLQPDGNYKPYIKESDTLYINVAPQLRYCNIDNLAGVIESKEYAYCDGVDMSEAITLSTDSDVEDYYYAADNFGAMLFKDGRKLYGYWEESRGKDNFAQTSEAITYEDGFDYKYYVEDLDTTTYVRFTISDGCSSLSTNEIALTVISFDEDSQDNYTVRYEYVEVGDNIKVTNTEKTISDEWYSSKNENGLIGESKSVNLEDVTYSTRLYHKRIKEVRKNNRTTYCTEPSFYEVKLDIHQKSKGGSIRSNQQICPGSEFADIKNYNLASGGTGKFRYRWEITTDSSEACDCWNPIENAYEDSLKYATYRKVLDPKKTNYIRRTATPIYNEKEVVESYTRYSNVISLETYKTLKVSELAWKDEATKSAFCSEESVPEIITDAPTGGSAEYKKDKYDLTWMYSVDGTNWNEYRNTTIMFGGTSEIYAGGIVYSYFENNNRDKDVTFYVKAVFKDEECGEIESKPFSFKVWAETETPSLYIGADSCDSKYISFIVENKTDYLYNWTIGTDSVNPVKTDFKDKYEMDFERHPAYVVEAGYSVQGMHKVSGCKTSIVNFNVDSLPELQQIAVPAQSSILCYGSDLKIEHGAATGGTGTRSYLWQYSYDNEKWNDATATQNFSYEDVRSDIYVRRLVYTDVCQDTIMTEPVLYKVADKIDPIQVSIEENLCKNQDMVVSLDSMPGNFNVVVYRLDADTIKETEITPLKLVGKIKGNDLAENNFGIVTWDSTYICKSEMIKKTMLPRPDFIGVVNNIVSDAEIVCEGSSITITSSTDYALPEYLKQRVESSADGMAWSVVKDNSEYQENVKVVVNDTAYFRTVLLNGCKDSIISNSVKVGGRKTVSNPMTFDVETTSDGEIKIVGNNNVDMAALALVVNDSIDYDFKDKITLAKETEKIIVSSKIGVDGAMICYSPVVLTPLKGGNIFTECLSTGKQIVGEDVINAGSDVTYKWYKYGNDSMMYFTDKTDKNYSLTIDDEKSKVVRVANFNTDNISYVLRSNVLTVNANGPALSKIVAVEKDSLISAGLKVSDYYMELNIGMNATLSCFIDDASNGEWQRSSDGITWITENKFDSTHLVSQTLAIDPKENIYYRVVATNSCGTTTGDSIFVSVEEIPAITEGCLELTLDDCEKTAKIICYDDEQKNYRPNYYEYSFEVIGECAKELDGDHGISLSGIVGEVEVVVTRHYKGISTKYVKRIDMSKSVGASFSIIAENVEYGSSEMTGDWLESVQVTSSAEVASGTKIYLNNRSENGKSYKWEVFYDGIKMATSMVENPQLYVYNEGTYSFHLTSYSGKCESTVSWESGISVQTGTLRSATVYEFDDFIVEPEFVSPLKEKKTADDIIEVYPTLVESEIHVSCPGNFSYSVYGTNGVLVMAGEGNGEVTINAENLNTGVYTILVKDSAFKVMKKQ